MSEQTREPGLIRDLRTMLEVKEAVGNESDFTLSHGEMEVLIEHHDAIVAERDAAVRERDEEKEARAEWEEESAAWSRQCLKVQEECAELRARLAECEKIVEAVAAIDPTIYNRRGDVIALSQAANVATETFRAAVAAETHTNTTTETDA